jgi:hypothetical protein
MDECAQYPLFTDELLDVMRRTIPRERWARVARSVIFAARKPGTQRASSAGGRAARAAASVALAEGRAAGLPAADALLDVGSAGCEEGVLLRLRNFIAGPARDQVLELRSTDPGVREDLPAWCRLTGNEFLTAHRGPVLRQEAMTISATIGEGGLPAPTALLDAGDGACGELMLLLKQTVQGPLDARRHRPCPFGSRGARRRGRQGQSAAYPRRVRYCLPHTRKNPPSSTV